MKKVGLFRSLLTFLAGGFVATAILLLRSSSHPAGEQRTHDSDGNVFGVAHTYGEDARRQASVAGVTIPSNAVDCFYCIGGLKPIEFIAFTVSPGEIQSTLSNFAARERAGGKLCGPEVFGAECRTVLFDLSHLPSTHTWEWPLKEGRLSAEAALDPATGRFFINILGD